MNSYFEKIKRRIQIVIISLNLISFIIITILINNKKRNYNEYTNLSRFFSNLYIIIILLILLVDSITPKCIPNIFSENISILTKSKGKISIIISIGCLFWTSNNFPHVLFGVINFISVFILILCEFIFDCKILKKKDKVNLVNNEQRINNGKNNNLGINNQNTKAIKGQNNASNVAFFEKGHNNDNYFENIKQVNLKAQNSAI